jgi:hypothetical protein
VVVGGAKISPARQGRSAAETNYNFDWAEAWVHRCHQHLDFALEHLEQAPGQLA